MIYTQGKLYLSKMYWVTCVNQAFNLQHVHKEQSMTSNGMLNSDFISWHFEIIQPICLHFVASSVSCTTKGFMSLKERGLNYLDSVKMGVVLTKPSNA